MTAIHTWNDHGVWWLVDVDGAPFVSLGVNHVQPDCWLAPYNRAFMRNRYGPDLDTPEGGFNPGGQALPRLVDATVARIRGLGFNTLGIHTAGVPARLFADDLFYCVAIDVFPLGSRFRFGEQRFPDIFSEEFASMLEARVREVCAEHRDRPRFIGYAFSDIPRWYFFAGEPRDTEPVHPWVLDLLALPEGAPGWQAAMDVLGRATARTREDSDAVMERVVARWYDLHTRLIRRHDPNHLLLGDKLHSPHRLPAWLPPILARSVDVLFVQWYSPMSAQRETLERLHRMTGKPVLNGDSSFGCAKPPRQTRVKGYPVASIAEAGKAYADYLRAAMSLPFMVGWHHCGWIEQWDGGKRVDWEVNENGLFDPFENPYPELTRPVAEANARAHAWHAEPGVRPAPEPAPGSCPP